MKKLFIPTLFLLALTFASQGWGQQGGLNGEQMDRIAPKGIDNVYTPQAFGAKCDGVTDDTAAFNAAVLIANNPAKSLYIPPTANGCKINGAWNLTTAPANFQILGSSTAFTSILNPGGSGSTIICGNTAGSGICADLTGAGNGLRIAGVNFIAPATGGSVIGLFCARNNATGSGPQHLALNNVTVWLNSSGSGTHPSIGLYNSGCELAHYENLSIQSDLPMYTTISNPSAATYTATSPFVTTTVATSTSEIHCDSCTLVNVSSLTPGLVTESAFDNHWTDLYITCKGAGAASQYAMSLLHPSRNTFDGRQENCGKLAHLTGAIANNAIHMGDLVGSVTTNSYIDFDGTVSATAWPTEGNSFEVFDQVGKISFTAYNWLSNSSVVASNLFDTRSGQNDGTVSITASICGGNTVRGKGTGGTLAVSGCPDTQILVPSATQISASSIVGSPNINNATLSNSPLVSGQFYLGSRTSGGATVQNNTGVANGGVTGTILGIGNAGVNFFTSLDASGNWGVAGALSPGQSTVGALPAAASGNKGFLRVVTDSTAIASEGQTCTGGSSNTALAVSNGSVWKCF